MATKKKVAPKKKEKKEIPTLLLRPEQIVKHMVEFGKLPEDFNPYGDYIPEPSRFLGDEPPKDTPYYIGVNEDDENIIPIYISTPIPPKDLSLIDNYNLPKDEQYWRK